MKVREFLDEMDRLMMNGNADDQVLVPYLGGSSIRGYTPAVEVEKLQVGFDWDNGRIFLSTKEPVWGADSLERLRKLIEQDVESNKDSQDAFIKAHNHGLQRALFLINELKRG